MMYLEFHFDWSLIVSLFLIQLCGVKLVMELYLIYYIYNNDILYGIYGSSYAI